MKTPTTHSVAATIKRAAAADGLGITTKRHQASGSVTVDTMWRQRTRDAGLTDFTGSLADWLRGVLTVVELRAVKVNVKVINSRPEIDYFNETHCRVYGSWQDYLESGDAGCRDWAYNYLDLENSKESHYRDNSKHHTGLETIALAPSENAARALAVWCVARAAVPYRMNASAQDPDGVRLVTQLGRTGQDLMLSMVDGWELSALELAQAVAVLSGVSLDGTPVQDPRTGARIVETPGPVELVAPAVFGEMPQAMSDYLGRLIHVPKKLYASRVYAALTAGEELPESDAVWADDVLKKVRRYARA